MPSQLNLGHGTEPPDHNPAVLAASDEWREARRECRRLREVRDLKHAALLALLEEHQLEMFSFVDELTGKKRRVRPVTTTKVKDETQPRERAAEDDADAELDSDEVHVAGADKVEKRNVSRASVAAELDPFAATRGEMEH